MAVGYVQNKNEKIVINQIIVKPTNRQILDVGKWGDAMKMADRGRRKDLFDLYENILTDGVLGDAIDKRIRAVTGSDLTFQLADGTEVEEMIEFIDTDEFEYLLEEILKAVFWEYSLIQATFNENGMHVFSVPRKHIRPETKKIAINETDPDGQIDYDGLDVIEVHSRKQKHGLLLRACPYAILKRGGIGDWAQMVEIFGMPQRIGKYSVHDVAARKALEDAFNSQGAAATLIVPKETDIETAQNASTGGGTLYKDFIATLDEQLLITILSQTMTTKNGSSRSQSETHKEVEEEVNKQDLRFVQRILNHKFLPILEKRGFPVKGGAFIFPKTMEQLTVSEIVSLSAVLPIPAYYVQERYGIPAAEAADEILQHPKPPQPDSDDTAPVETEHAPSKKDTGGNEKDTEPSKSQSPKTKSRLRDFFAFAPTQERGSKPNFIAKWTNSISGTITNLADRAAYGVDINALFNQAIKDIYSQYGETFEPDDFFGDEIDSSLFEISNTAYQKAIDTQFTKAGAEFGKKNEAFINEFKHNAAVFAAFKSHKQTKDIIGQLLDENGELRSFHEFKKAVMGSHINENYNQNWLKTEYNMAVRSARSSVQFKKFWGLKHLYPNLEYLESTARKKRKEHLEYVGTILPIEHPWWDEHLPPVEWGCECSVRNTDKPATAVPDDGGAPINPVFAHNPAKTAEIVNMKEHPYVKGVCKYFPTCTRRTYPASSNSLMSLTDQEPPITPQCAICEMVKKTIIEGFLEFKKYKNGGRILIHPLVDKNKNDYKDILTIANEFAKQGKTVRLTPNVHYKSKDYKAIYSDLIGTKYERKCPYIQIDGLFFEYESFLPPFKKRKISNMISHGTQQSSRIIIDNNKGCTDSYIIRNIHNRLKDKTFRREISEVWVYEKGKVRMLYKKR